MKSNSMKMFIVGFLLAISSFVYSTPPCTSYPSPVIQSDFLATCQVKERPGQQNNCVLACENSTISYFTQNTGNTFTWTVFGATSYTPSGNTVSVDWGGVGSGLVQVTETDANGCATTVSICIQIVESPKADFTAVPQILANSIQVCLGADINFYDASTSDVITWIWDFDDGTFSNSPNPIHNYAAPGTYNVTLTVYNDCGCSHTKDVKVIVDPADAPQITCLSTQCVGDRVTYSVPNACPGAIYQWNVISGGFIQGSNTDPTVTVVWNNPVNGQGILEVLVTGCSVCPIPTQVVIPIITNNLAIDGPMIVCQGDLTEYSVPPQPGNTYVWNITPGGWGWGSPAPHGSTVEVVWYNTGTYTISLTITNGDLGCPIDYPIFTKQVEVKSPFTMSSSKAEICNNISDASTFTLNPTVTGGTVNWTAIDASNTSTPLFGGNNSNITVNGAALAPGYYEIRATTNSSDYCNTYASGFLTVKPASPQLTAAAFSGPTLVCLNSCYEYTATPDNGYYLQWDVVGGYLNGVPGTLTSNGNNATICWGSIPPHQIRITQLAMVGEECPSLPLVINVSPLVPVAPPITHSSGQNNFCADVITNFTTSPPSQATHLEWSFQNPTVGSVISGQNTSNVSVQLNYFTTMVSTNLVLETTICGSIYTSLYPITITSPPTMAITAAPDPSCQNANVTFTGTLSSNPGGTINWLWDYGDGSTPNASPNHVYNTYGSMPVTATASFVGGVCDGRSSVGTTIHTVNPAPLVNITATNGFGVCAPAVPNTTLIASVTPLPGSTGVYSYSWSDAGGSLGSGPTLFVNAANPGITLTVTDVGTGCTSTLTRIIEGCGPPNPCAGVTGIDFDQMQNNCNNFDFTQNISIPFIPGTIQWTFSDGSPMQFGNTASHTFATSGIYQVRISVELPGGQRCGWTENVTVIFVPDFIWQFECVGPDMVTSLIDQTNFIGSPSLSFAWNLPGGSVYTGGTNASSQNPTAIIPSGTQNIMLTVTDGVTTCNITWPVPVPAPVVASFTHDAPKCEGIPVNFTSGVASPFSALWTFGDGSSSTLTNPDRNYNGLGGSNPTVTLTLVDEWGCTDMTSQTITIHQNTLLNNVSVNPAGPFCANSGAQLTANVTGGTPGYTYNWGMIDGTPFGGGNPTTNTVAMTNGYLVTVTDANGCVEVSDPVNVVVQPVPNAIVVGQDEYCRYETVMLSGNQGTGYTYNWNIGLPGGGTLTPTGPTAQFFGNPDGAYTATVTLTDALTGCSDVSSVFNGTVHNTPQGLTITPSSGCAPIGLTASATGAVNYAWSNGTTGPNTTALSGGTIEVIAYTSEGCEASQSVNLDDSPDLSDLAVGCYCFPEPTTWTAPQGPGYTYQWFLNGVAIGGATNGQYTFTQSGVYTVTVTNSAGCSSTSADIIIDISDNCRECKFVIDWLAFDCIGYDAINGGPLYEITIDVYNYGIGLTNFSATSPQGVVHNSSFMPTNSVPSGGTPTTLTFQFTLTAGGNSACFVFSGTGVNGITCEYEICTDQLPPCIGGGDPCKAELGRPKVKCIYTFGGNSYYSFSIPAFNLGNAVTNVTWTPCDPSVQIMTSTNTLPGMTTTVISGNIIAPSNLGSTCFTGVGIDPATGQKCEFYFEVRFPECGLIAFPCNDAKVKKATIGCVSPLNVLNNLNYSLNVTVSSAIANGNVIIKPIGSQMENFLTNVNVATFGNSYTINAQIVDIPPHNSPLCFEVYIFIGHDVCITKFCVERPDCPEGGGSSRNGDVTASAKLDSHTKLQVSPNPASTALNVAYELDGEGMIELRMIRMDGQLVRHITNLKQEVRMPLDISDLPNGMYSLLLFKDGHLMAEQKVVKVSTN